MDYREGRAVSGCTIPFSWSAAEAQLHIHVDHLAQRAASTFGADTREVPFTVAKTVANLMRRLKNGDREAARTICFHVVDSYGDSAFWRTALGQALAWVVGYPDPEVPQATAAVILGVSRQRIGQITGSGTTPMTDVGVQSRLHAKYHVA
jgi:hypothetical protein